MSKRNHDDARKSYVTARDHKAFLTMWHAQRASGKTAHQLAMECPPCDIDAVHKKQVTA